MPERQEVYRFTKSTLEEVRAAIYPFQGKLYADLRVFWRDPETGEYKPSRKGVTVSVDLLPELARAVGKMRGAASSSE